MASDFDLFVIGGGSAGVRCARIAAGYGAKVAIAEERFWGGTCVNVGCVPKKLLVQAGEYGAWADDARGFGWDIEKGPHSWSKLIAAKDREISRLNAIYRRLLEQAGAAVFESRAVLVGPHTIELGGQEVTADRIVLAVGGHPVRPAIPGGELAIVSDDAFFLKTFPENVVIVGGGYIAVEFAGIFQALGADVDLVYRQPLPLRGFDHDLREALVEALQGQGVTLHPASVPLKLEVAGNGRRLTLTNGRVLDADLAFFAIGRRPATDGLGLDRAGVATNGMGAVVVDDGLQSSQPHIFAMGDATDRLNLTPVAIAEARAIAETLYNDNPVKMDHNDVPTAVFSQPPIGAVGLTEDQARRQYGEVDVYCARFKPMKNTLSGRDERTLMKLVVDARTDRVLGCHMLGPDAPEIMQGLAIAVKCGASKRMFDQTVGIHPSAAEEFVTMREKMVLHKMAAE